MGIRRDVARSLAGAGLFLVMLATLVHGDRVVLQSGEVYNGRIVSQDSNEIRLRTSFAELTLPKRLVRSFEFDTDPPRLDSLWRSALVPGWGQFWHDRPAFGTAYAVGTAAALVTAIVLQVRYDSARRDYEADRTDRTLYDRADSRRRAANAAFLVTAGLWLWQSADAYLFAPAVPSRVALTPEPLPGGFGLNFSARY